MKNYSIILIAVLTLASCNRRQKTPVLEQSPEALEESGLGSSFEFKRGEENLLENIYAELAEKDPALKKLEEQLYQLHEEDSTKAFDEYNRKNTNYYAGAKSLNVNDSVLLKKMKSLIEASETRYKKHIEGHTNILTGINTKTATVEDLHALIKLTYTLPIIEQYQTGKLPPTKSLENYDAQLKKTIDYENSITKK